MGWCPQAGQAALSKSWLALVARLLVEVADRRPPAVAGAADVVDLLVCQIDVAERHIWVVRKRLHDLVPCRRLPAAGRMAEEVRAEKTKASESCGGKGARASRAACFVHQPQPSEAIQRIKSVLPASTCSLMKPSTLSVVTFLACASHR